MDVKITERQNEIAIRWTEVHLKRIRQQLDLHMNINDCDFLCGPLLITITLRKKENEWCPFINVSIDQYKKDIIFCYFMTKDTPLSVIRQTFQFTTIPFCVCGRLGRTHEIESLTGMCDNCYIYGMFLGEPCSICLSDDGKPYLQTKCGHSFHDMCWSRVQSELVYQNHQWVNERKCPICRTLNTSYEMKEL